MHIMVDLETLGTSPGSIILSIGAVSFCPMRQEIRDEFYINIDRDLSLDCGMTTSQDTVDWWSRQSQEAIAALLVDPVSPLHASQKFREFWSVSGGEFIWSHGATFDIPLMEAMFRMTGAPTPWKFWNARDTRTIFDISRCNPDRTKGTHHNALDDARNQAEAVLKAYRMLGLVGESA